MSLELNTSPRLACLLESLRTPPVSASPRLGLYASVHMHMHTHTQTHTNVCAGGTLVLTLIRHAANRLNHHSAPSPHRDSPSEPAYVALYLWPGIDVSLFVYLYLLLLFNPLIHSLPLSLSGTQTFPGLLFHLASCSRQSGCCFCWGKLQPYVRVSRNTTWQT